MARTLLTTTALLLLLACGGTPDEPSRSASTEPAEGADRPAASERAERRSRTEAPLESMTAGDPVLARQKIRFDLEAIGDDGLVGPPDGRHAVFYEFCIPRQPGRVSQIKAIDSTIEIHGDTPGRVGCTSSEILCTGHTRQPHFRDVLIKLAEFSYVKEIQESDFE